MSHIIPLVSLRGAKSLNVSNALKLSMTMLFSALSGTKLYWQQMDVTVIPVAGSRGPGILQTRVTEFNYNTTIMIIVHVKVTIEFG